MISRLPIIGVMGSHIHEWPELAIPVGRLIAEHGYHLLTGAGGGVMMSASKAFTEYEHRDGVCIGIVPTREYNGQMVPSSEYQNEYVEVPIITPLDVKALSDTVPYSRNYVNIMTSNAVVVLPGDHGTHNEVALSIMFKKPMVLFGPEKAFERFPDKHTRVDTIEEVKEFLEKATAKFKDGER
jgi:uncharacterized protein (TIGR00725 family)